MTVSNQAKERRLDNAFYPLDSDLSRLVTFSVSLTGSNVLLLRNNLSCGVHLLFALLCGRPVVVLGEPRNERFVFFTLRLIFTI